MSSVVASPSSHSRTTKSKARLEKALAESASAFKGSPFYDGGSAKKGSGRKKASSMAAPLPVAASSSTATGGPSSVLPLGGGGAYEGADDDGPSHFRAATKGQQRRSVGADENEAQRLIRALGSGSVNNTSNKALEFLSHTSSLLTAANASVTTSNNALTGATTTASTTGSINSTASNVNGNPPRRMSASGEWVLPLASGGKEAGSPRSPARATRPLTPKNTNVVVPPLTNALALAAAAASSPAKKGSPHYAPRYLDEEEPEQQQPDNSRHAQEDRLGGEAPDTSGSFILYSESGSNLSQGPEPVSVTSTNATSAGAIVASVTPTITAVITTTPTTTTTAAAAATTTIAAATTTTTTTTTTNNNNGVTNKKGNSHDGGKSSDDCTAVPAEPFIANDLIIYTAQLPHSSTTVSSNVWTAPSAENLGLPVSATAPLLQASPHEVDHGEGAYASVGGGDREAAYSSTGSAASDFSALLERAAALEDKMMDAEARLLASARRDRYRSGTGAMRGSAEPFENELHGVSRISHYQDDGIDKNEATELNTLEHMVSILHHDDKEEEECEPREPVAVLSEPAVSIIADKEKIIAELTERLRERDAEVEQRRLSRLLLAEELEAVRSVNKRLQAEALKVQLQASEREILDKTNRLAAMSAVTQHVSGILTKSQSDVVRLEAELSSLQASKAAEIAALDEELALVSAKYDGLVHCTAAEREELYELKASLEARQEDLEKERAQVANHRRSIAGHRQSIAKHRQSIAHHRMSIEMRKSALDKQVQDEVLALVHQEREVVSERVTSLEAAAEAAREEVAAARAREAAEAHARSALAEDLAKLSAEVLALEAAKADLVEALESLAEEQAQTASANAALKAELGAVLAEKAAVLETDEAKFEQVMASITEAQRVKEAQTEAQVEELIDELANIQAALARETEEKNVEAAARERLGDEMKEMKIELDKSEAIIAAKIAFMQSEIERLGAAAVSREAAFASEVRSKDMEAAALEARLRDADMRLHEAAAAADREKAQILAMMSELSSAQEVDKQALESLEAEARQRDKITALKTRELEDLELSGRAPSHLVLSVRAAITAWHNECAEITIKDAIQRVHKDYVIKDREEQIEALRKALEAAEARLQAETHAVQQSVVGVKAALEVITQSASTLETEVSYAVASWRAEQTSKQEEVKKLQVLLAKVRRRSSILSSGVDVTPFGSSHALLDSPLSSGGSGDQGPSEGRARLVYKHVQGGGAISSPGQPPRLHQQARHNQHHRIIAQQQGQHPQQPHHLHHPHHHHHQQQQQQQQGQHQQQQQAPQQLQYNQRVMYGAQGAGRPYYVEANQPQQSAYSNQPSNVNRTPLRQYSAAQLQSQPQPQRQQQQQPQQQPQQQQQFHYVVSQPQQVRNYGVSASPSSYQYRAQQQPPQRSSMFYGANGW